MTEHVGEGRRGLSEQELAERLAAANRRRETLNQWVVRRRAEHEQCQQRLQELRSEAEREFGTSDLDEMRERYRQRRAANEAALARYERELDEAEKLQAEVEAQLSGRNGG